MAAPTHFLLIGEVQEDMVAVGREDIIGLHLYMIGSRTADGVHETFWRLPDGSSDGIPWREIFGDPDHDSSRP